MSGEYDFITSVDDLRQYVSEDPERTFMPDLSVQIKKSEESNYDELKVFFIEHEETPGEGPNRVFNSLWFDINTKQRVDKPAWAEKREKKVAEFAEEIATKHPDIDEDQYREDIEYRKKIKRAAQQTLIERGELSKNPRK